MLEEMAKSLGYRSVTWDVIDDSYYPRWLVAEHENTKNQAKMIKMATGLFPTVEKMVNPSPEPQRKNKR